MRCERWIAAEEKPYAVQCPAEATHTVKVRLVAPCAPVEMVQTCDHHTNNWGIYTRVVKVLGRIGAPALTGQQRGDMMVP